MPSSLPTEQNDEKVDDFGIGTYDSDNTPMPDTENAKRKHTKNSLPQNGGPFDPFGPDRLLSYPTHVSTAMLPADLDYATGRSMPQKSHYDSVVHSEANSELPNEDDGSHVTDYADPSRVSFSEDNLWSSDGGDSYASAKSESLPHSTENSMKTENNLGALGNPYSGYIVQDQNVPQGFPSEDYRENSSFPKSHPGNMIASRIATNVELVRDLTKEFLKGRDKDSITKRDITAFLAKNGYFGFMSSDVIRCLRLDHDLHVQDALDVFPVRKASQNFNLTRIAALRDFCVMNDMENISNPEVSADYRVAAACLSSALAVCERYLGE